MRPQRVKAGWAGLTGTGEAASLGLGLLVLICVFVAVAMPRASLGMRTRALQRTLAATPPVERSMLADASLSNFTAGLTGPLSAADISGAGAQLARHLAAAHLPLAAPRLAWSGLTTSYNPVSGVGRAAVSAGTPPRVELAYRDALGRNMRMVAGRLPARSFTARNGVVFEVAVTSATAARFGLRVGSRPGLLGGGSSTAVSLQVSGIIRPVAPRSAFWTADPVAASPSPNYGPFGALLYWLGAAFIGPAEVPALQTYLTGSAMTVSWDFPLSLGQVTADQAPALRDELAGAVAHAGLVQVGSQGAPADVAFSSGLASTLSGFIAEDDAVGRVLALLAVSLTVVGATVVLLGARLLAEHRSDDFAVQAARGASRLQIALAAVRGGAVVTAPAAALAIVLAVAVTPGYGAPLSWWLAAVTVLVALAGPPLLTLLRIRAGVLAGGSVTGRARARRAARRVVAEAALVAAAVGGLVVLSRQGPPAAGGLDVYTAAAPALVAVPAAILVMRGYPVLLRWLLRLAGSRPGVTGFLGLARAYRVPAGSVLTVFALVLALAVVAFGAMVRAAVLRGEVAASWAQTGADAVVNAAGSPQPLSPAVQRAIAAVPGAERTATLVLTSGSLADGTVVTVAAVDPGPYASLTALTPEPPFPAGALAMPPARGREHRPVPAVVSPAAAASFRRGRTSLSLGLRSLPVRITRTIISTPAVPNGAFLVLPRQALAGLALPPTTMLVVGPHLQGNRLDAVAGRLLPGATVTLRSAALAALAGAELPHGAYVSFAQGAAAAAGFSLLILLISLLLSARPREITLARVATMGLSGSQARWLVVIEALPQVLAATVGGIACAWVLAPLVGPSVDLSVFTGSAAAVAIRPEPAALAGTAGGLVVLALVTLVAQTAIASHRGTARWLRGGE